MGGSGRRHPPRRNANGNAEGGVFSRRRSHAKTTGSLRGERPSDGPDSAAVAGQEPGNERRRALSPRRADRRPRRPPRRDRRRPAGQRAPARLAGPIGIAAGDPAVHAHEGVDRLVVVAVPDRWADGEEPGRHDGGERVPETRQHRCRRNGACLAATAAQEAPHPGEDNASIGLAGDDHPATPLAVAPEVQRPRHTGDDAAVRAARRSYRADRRHEQRDELEAQRRVDRLHRPNRKIRHPGREQRC